MLSAYTIFLVIALILAIFAAIQFPSTRINLFAAAFVFYILALLFGHLSIH